MPPASRIALTSLVSDRTLVESARPLCGNRRERRGQIGLNQRVALVQRRAVGAGKHLAPTKASAPAVAGRSASVSAMSSATAKPSRARSIDGCSNSASVNLPEPYFSSASANPATVPGTPMPSAESRDFAISGLPSAPRKISRRGRGRRGLAIIDRDILVALRRVNHHEAAAADISGARIGHGHRKSGGHRGIDRIAAALEHIGADSCARVFPAPPPCRVRRPRHGLCRRRQARKRHGVAPARGRAASRRQSARVSRHSRRRWAAGKVIKIPPRVQTKPAPANTSAPASPRMLYGFRCWWQKAFP